MSLCKECLHGVRHSGTPEGRIENIDGIRVYIATPTVDYPRNKAILFLTDVFGIELINSQLLADDFSRNGFYTVMPDFLNNDSVPADALDPNSDFIIRTGMSIRDFTFQWLAKHRNEETRPPLDRILKWLKEKGVKELGATGYCFGGRFVFNLAFENLVKVAVVSHPSLIIVPLDFEKYKTHSTAPLLINTCKVDQQFPPSSQRMADDVLGGGKYQFGYKREHFEGCMHGFAVRGDLSDPNVKAGKEGSFKATIEWFLKYL